MGGFGRASIGGSLAWACVNSQEILLRKGGVAEGLFDLPRGVPGQRKFVAADQEWAVGTHGTGIMGILIPAFVHLCGRVRSGGRL